MSSLANFRNILECSSVFNAKVSFLVKHASVVCGEPTGEPLLGVTYYPLPKRGPHNFAIFRAISQLFVLGCFGYVL